MTGQSQIIKKSCFKSSTQNDEKDIFGHVAICCVFTQRFHQLAYFDRFVNTQMEDPHGDNPKIGQDIVIRDANMYFDGTSSVRFTNLGGTY